jgi:hypothetical protein
MCRCGCCLTCERSAWIPRCCRLHGTGRPCQPGGACSHTRLTGAPAAAAAACLPACLPAVELVADLLLQPRRTLCLPGSQSATHTVRSLRQQALHTRAESVVLCCAVAGARQVTVDVPWSPYDIDGRSYDFKGLSEAADLLFIMMYDTQSQVGPEVDRLTGSTDTATAARALASRQAACKMKQTCCSAPLGTRIACGWLLRACWRQLPAAQHLSQAACAGASRCWLTISLVPADSWALHSQCQQPHRHCQEGCAAVAGPGGASTQARAGTALVW